MKQRRPVYESKPFFESRGSAEKKRSGIGMRPF